MPYCWKCGAKVPEDAEFCPVCGTPVAPSKVERERRPIIPLAIVVPLIVIIVIAAVVGTVSFLPVKSVDISESRDVPYQEGIEKVTLDFTADIARVNVAFEHLAAKLVTLDVSATGRVGALVSPDVLNLTFDYTTEGNVLTVTLDVDTEGPWWRVLSWVRVTCDLHIDPSMSASLNVKTSFGKIVMDTRAGVVLNSLSLEATTGGVEADLVKDVVVAGNVSVKATTGGVEFSWVNVIVRKDVLVNVETTTGGVDVDVKQDEELLKDVILQAEATTGGVDFAIDIQGDIGAIGRVIAGDPNAVRAHTDGFGITFLDYPPALLRSENYPASSNFDLTLKTTTGGIDIEAEYTP